MRICLLARGTRGDVQPLVALGRGLRAAGYRVTVAANPEFTPMITGAGLETAPVDAETATQWQAPDRQRWLNGSDWGIRQERQQWRRNIAQAAPGIADHLAGLVDHHDVFFSGVATFPAMMPMARATGKRHVIAFLTPNAPTRSGPASMYAVRPDRDSLLNLAAGWATRLGFTQVLWSLTQAACARLGLPRYSLRDFFQDARRTPALLGASPSIVPHPPDVRDRLQTTGYWVDPLDPDYTPPADLEAFLQAGPAPVYLGFGSMPSADPAGLVELTVTALQRTGRRGLIHGNWGGWRPDDLPDEVRFLDEVPHEWLFPRTAAVVHHGGAGTTVTAARAGIPQFAVPHLGEQAYWGRRIAQLGLGPAPVPRRDLDADGLTTALTRLTGDRTVQARAERFGTQVKAEDGVAEAVAATRRLLQG